jgi:hypothetical protein
LDKRENFFPSLTSHSFPVDYGRRADSSDTLLL